MTVILVGAAKGSPGVTTTVLALAARWPDNREPVIVEADPSGGDIVARLAALTADGQGVNEAPSTVQLAAASRSGVIGRTFLEHLQRLPGPGEVRALVAPAGPFAASTAITALDTAGLGPCLLGLGSLDVLIDAGRIDAGAPTISLARAANQVLLVARPTLESALHTRELAGALRSLGCAIGVLVVGSNPYAPAEVAAAIGAENALELPEDAVAAAALGGDGRSSKVLGRTRLLRAASAVAADLAPLPSPTAATWPPAEERLDVRVIHERLKAR